MSRVDLTSDDHEPDLLAGAALRALTREHPLPPRWGAAKSVLVGAVTFGVLPIYAWPKAFRTAATIEQQQLWHLAEWVRLRSGHPEDGRLSKLAARVGFRPVMWTLSMLCVAVAAACFATQASIHGFNWLDLRAATYGLGKTSPAHLPFFVAQQLFVVWTVGLCLAYTVHWLHLQMHSAQVRRFVDAFNEISTREGIRPLQMRAMGLGIRPAWTIGAVALVSVGGIWAIPMVLGGVVQARWKRESRIVRAGLSDALRQMLMMRRPVMRVPRPVKLGEFCENDLCRGRVPPQALFCPRCGLHVPDVAGLDKVA